MPQPYSVFKDGNGTLAAAGTRQQLSVTSVPCGKVFVSAGKNNRGDLVFGGTTVVGAVSGRSGNGVQPGVSMTIEIDDLSKVWIDGENTGDIMPFPATCSMSTSGSWTSATRRPSSTASK
jgi:hypothetical protein